MGYLAQKYVENKGKRYLIYIILDILLIVALLFFAYSELGTFQAGYNLGFQNGQVSCVIGDILQDPNAIPDIQDGHIRSASDIT